MSRPALLTLLILAAGTPAHAATLTVDEAVRIALQHSTEVVQSDAGVLNARGGLWSAYTGVLPSVRAAATRSGSFTGSPAAGTGLVAPADPTLNTEGHSTVYDVTGNWPVLDLSSWTNLSAARKGMRASQLNRTAARQNVVFATKTQFYEVVRAMHLAGVSAQALKLARDNERRVRALFEVGSVSKSDLLKAKVNTAQSQIDSLTADHNVTFQRIRLARQMGVAEGTFGDVDSTLSATHAPIDGARVLADARASRPDIRAAEASLKAAELRLRSANLARLPSLSLSGTWTPDSRQTGLDYLDARREQGISSSFESKDAWSGRLAVSMDVFSGFLIEGRIATARAGVLGARETRDALVRNLESEVRQSLLGYQEATEREALARSALESASENLNLVQQKYNVGSATILDLIDSQVQLQRAKSDLVSALAGIREAEAKLGQVRGVGE